MFSDIFKDDGVSTTHQNIQTTFPGVVCLLGYLISDSFTPNWQEKLMTDFSMSSISVMLVTNMFSSIYTFTSILYQGEWYDSIAFLYEHSNITWHVALLSITSAIGQIFIFVTIQEFGALWCSIFMTTRQILSIFFSAMLFHQQLSFLNCLGIFLVFSAVFIQYYKKIKKSY